ncbi:MAG TPA: phospholipase [Thermoguttaceae bacterium]|nr:phospholipase [Thermoguttaceae bacterium]
MSSQIHSATETLRTLHRLHRQLTDLKGRLRRGPQLVAAHQNNVQRCKNELAKAQDDAKHARMAADAKQGKLRDSEEKIKKLRIQLNTANSNREYQALLEQIAATEMTNSVMADEILEGLEKVDELAQKVTAAEDQLNKAVAQAAVTQKDTDTERPAIETDVARLEGELRETERGLPGDFKPLYERTVAVRGEAALAPLRGEYCLGCNHKVPLNDINKLLMPEPKPLVCRACGRLLYVPEDWAQER